jgi:hypothetical protein
MLVALAPIAIRRSRQLLPLRYLAAWSRTRRSAAWRPALERLAAAGSQLFPDEPAAVGAIRSRLHLPAIVSVPPRHAMTMSVSAGVRWRQRSDTASLLMELETA